MATVNYGGKSYTFPDSMSDDEIYAQLDQVHAQEQGQDTTTPAPEPDEGSILGAVGAHFAAQNENALAASVQEDNSSLSDYMAAKAKKATQRDLQEEEKLSGWQSIAAGAIEYAPAMAVSMINPIAGAGVMSGISEANELERQAATGSDYDTGKAQLVGAASGATDLALGGLAGQAAGAARRGISNIAEEWTSPIAKQAARAAETVAGNTIEAAGQSVNMMGQTAIQNAAAGRDLTEGMGEAALTGAAMHAGFKAAGMGVRGLNKAMGFEFNPAGKAAQDTIRNTEKDTGITLNPDLVDNHIELQNARQAILDQADSAPIDVDVSKTYREMADTNARNYAASAIPEGINVLNSYGADILPHTLDIDVQAGLGHDTHVNPSKLHGYSDEDIIRSSHIPNEIVAPLTKKGQAAAQARAETPVSYQEKNSKVLDKLNGNVVRSGSDNLETVIGRLDEETKFKNEGDIDTEMVDNLGDLRDVIDKINKIRNQASNGQLKEVPLRELARYQSQYDDLLRKTGLRDQMIDHMNNKGATDIIKEIGGIHTALKSLHRNDVAVRTSNPNVAKEGLGKVGAAGEEGINLGLNIATGKKVLSAATAAAKAIAKRGGKGSYSVRELRRIRAEGKILGEKAATGARVQEHLKEGDTAGGAKEAAESLRKMGINPGEDVTGASAAPESGSETFASRNFANENEAINRTKNISSKDVALNQKARSEAQRAKRRIKEVNEEVSKQAAKHGLTEEQIHEAISKSGKVEDVKANPKANVEQIARAHKETLQKAEEERNAQSAETIAKEAEKHKLSLTDTADRINKHLKAQHGEDFKSEIFDEAVAEAKRTFGDKSDKVSDFAGAIGKIYNRLVREASAKAEGKGAESLTSGDKPTTIQESKDDIVKWTKENYDPEVLADGEVQRIIRKATLHTGRDRSPLSTTKIRDVINKIHDRAEAMQKEVIDAAEEKIKESKSEKEIKKLREFVKDQNKKLSSRVTEVGRLTRKLDRQTQKTAERLNATDAKTHAKIRDAIAKVQDDVTKEVAEKMEAKLTEVLGDDLSDTQILKLVEGVLEKMSAKTFKDDTSKDFHNFKAASDLAAAHLKAMGKVNEAKAIEKQKDILSKGLEAKKEFPDNDDLWMSYEDELKLNDLFKGKESANSYMGTLSTRIRIALFGDIGGKSNRVRFDNDKIEQIKEVLRNDPQADLSRFYSKARD